MLILITAGHPDVISVFENDLKRLHTTRTWAFIGAERNGYVPPNSIWAKADYGKDVIIANLDTGFSNIMH